MAKKLTFEMLTDQEKIAVVQHLQRLRNHKSIMFEDRVSSVRGPFGKLFYLLFAEVAVPGERRELAEYRELMDGLKAKYECAEFDFSSFP
ncbi:hypothetical protein AB0B66_36790 [Catellatospora sp. NPDC049111]|uniref:hypothetical protein n=1 Tax=Catellatospora sp. NPDC049111 TaxID=3155271 RepID=UPI0034047B76